MKKDIRSTELYSEIAAVFHSWHHPESEMPSDAEQLSASPDGNSLAFTGTVFSSLDLSPRTRVCLIESKPAAPIRFIPNDGNNDRQPVWSQDGNWLAFLSDRGQAGNFQLVLTKTDAIDELISTPAVQGCVESLAWSPSGQQVLLGVAGLGADLAGCQGGVRIASEAEPGGLPDWLPEIDSGDAENLWRSVWVYDCLSGQVYEVPTVGLNVWESVWLGDDALLAVVSAGHSEASWYRSRLVRIDVSSGAVTSLFQPEEQIGLPVANTDGSYAAIVQAVCSDRLLVAGNLNLINTATGESRLIDTHGVDVTHLAWRSSEILVYAGHRGFETVAGEWDARSGKALETWVDAHRTCGAWYPIITPMQKGGFAAVIESYDQPPTLTLIDGQSEQVVLSLDNPDEHARVTNSGHAEAFSWTARDGLEMQGWLIRPHNVTAPAPLVMDIHGGPIWACRNRWMGRLRGAKALTDRGVVSFYPNPRGSGGRGQEFAAMVRGDMGGEDTYDYLTGIDALVEQGIADPERLGVTGISYGGFMSSWLITQDDRFAAAVPISPVTNWYSQHRTSQIPFFDEYFLDGKANEPDGKFFNRSPVMFADRVKCPTLILAGGLDHNTPPTQALEFHRALLESGVESVLVTYPTAGHGIRTFPEVIDHTTRYVGWLLKYL